MKKLFKIVIWAGIIFFVIFCGFTALGFWHQNELKKTADAVDKINSVKITLDDVMGKNLPPKPDQALNDSTIAGFDVNNNYIRDDVELAIFEKYPKSAKIRAAMLQYAQALQLEFTKVFNIITLEHVSRRAIDSGFHCVGNWDRIEEVESIVLNTTPRKENWDNLREKYLKDDPIFDGVSFPVPENKEKCDINSNLLPN